MSERKFIDPMTSSFREERALIGIGNKLLSWNPSGANGVFYRLGVITYIKSLIVGNFLPDDLKDECSKIISNDKDYLIELLEGRRASIRSGALALAYDAPPVTLPEPTKESINWQKIPRDRWVSTYIQMIMEEDFRSFWISKYNSSDEDNRFDILNQFADDVICRHKADENKPFRLTDKGEIRKVLCTWAEAIRGFDE